MEEVVAPVDQTYEVPPDAVSVTLSPVQIAVGPEAVIAATGGGVVLMDWKAVSVPQETVAITE